MELKIRFLLILVGDVYCCSGLFNSDKLRIFKFGKFKILKNNFEKEFQKKHKLIEKTIQFQQKTRMLADLYLL